MNEEVPRRQTRVLDKQRMRSFLLGGVAGILAGILLAPRSGRELRGSVMERAGEARERGRESLFEARERMQERLSEALEGSQQGPSSVRESEDTVPRRPRLGDVVSSEVAGSPAERSEELRRKVRETRDRLKGRVEGPRGVGEDRDLMRPDR